MHWRLAGNLIWIITASNSGKSSTRSDVIMGSVDDHRVYQQIQDSKKISANGQGFGA
jgi:hypothetical protein